MRGCPQMVYAPHLGESVDSALEWRDQLNLRLPGICVPVQGSSLQFLGTASRVLAAGLCHEHTTFSSCSDLWAEHESSDWLTVKVIPQ